MSKALVIALLSAVLAACAGPKAPNDGGSSRQSATAPASETKSAAGLTIDSPIEDLKANPQAFAVVNRIIPALFTHPSYDLFRAMSLVDLKPLSTGQITDAALEQVKKELAALK